MKRREFIPKYDHANFVFSSLVITIYAAVDLAQFSKISADIEFYADLFLVQNTHKKDTFSIEKCRNQNPSLQKMTRLFLIQFIKSFQVYHELFRTPDLSFTENKMY